VDEAVTVHGNTSEVFSVLSVFENVLPLKRVDLPRTRELICEIEELLLEKGIKPGVDLLLVSPHRDRLDLSGIVG
jgi:hypothetical protein